MIDGLLRVLGFGSPRPVAAHGQTTEALGDAAGRVRTVADPFDGLRKVDLTGDTDLITLAASGLRVRSLYIGASGGGVLKVDHYDLDGATVLTAQSIPVTDNQVFPAGCITKIYSTGSGTTVTSLWLGA